MCADFSPYLDLNFKSCICCVADLPAEGQKSDHAPHQEKPEASAAATDIQIADFQTTIIDLKACYINLKTKGAQQSYCQCMSVKQKFENFHFENQGSKSVLQRDLKRKESAIEEYSRAEEARKQQAAARRLRCNTAIHPQFIPYSQQQDLRVSILLAGALPHIGDMQ